jgi:hypothetical protein
VDAYTTIDRYDNGYYSMDGAKATIGIGSVQLGLFAAATTTVNTNNGANFMAVHGGSVIWRTLPAAHPPLHVERVSERSTAAQAPPWRLTSATE